MLFVCLYLLPADNSHIQTTQNESSVCYFFLLLSKLKFCIMFHKKIIIKYETNPMLNKNHNQDITFSWKMSNLRFFLKPSNFSEDRNDFHQNITAQVKQH